MSFVVYHKTSFKRIRSSVGAESFATKGAAVRSMQVQIQRSIERHDREAAQGYSVNWNAMRRDDYIVATYEEWAAAEPMVETYNMLDPERRVVMIRASDKGGCCDPATETYRSM